MLTSTTQSSWGLPIDTEAIVTVGPSSETVEIEVTVTVETAEHVLGDEVGLEVVGDVVDWEEAVGDVVVLEPTKQEHAIKSLDAEDLSVLAYYTHQT